MPSDAASERAARVNVRRFIRTPRSPQCPSRLPIEPRIANRILLSSHRERYCLRVVPDDASILPNLRKGTLEFAVLAILTEGRHYSGDLVATLATKPGLEVDSGTLYPLLARLRRRGFVDSEWEESPSGPPRRYYQLTRSGVDALRHFGEAWTPFATSLTSLMGVQQ